MKIFEININQVFERYAQTDFQGALVAGFHVILQMAIGITPDYSGTFLEHLIILTSHTMTKHS
jgi:hypothetical protein